MIVLDASVAIKWFGQNEPQRERAMTVLNAIQSSPAGYVVPETFIAECLAVLCRAQGATAESVQESMMLLASLGIQRIGLGHDLLQEAAAFSMDWGLSGYDAIYVALASLTDSVWLTADARAARRVKRASLVRLL